MMAFRKLTLDAVNRAATTLDGIAGKSVNVAKVLHALGEQPVAVGFLGGDRGEFLRRALAARGIATEFATVVAPTRQCITVIDEAGGTITELVEEGGAVTAAECEALTGIIRRRMPGCAAVVMSGTLAKGVGTGFYFQCASAAHKAGAITVVDAQGQALTEALRATPGLVKPNRLELAATVGHELRDVTAVMEAMRELHRRGAQRVVITAGKEPSLAFDGRTFWKVAAPAIAALNPIGSGDAFTAGLTWRLLRGDDLGEACRWAAASGSANALTPMAGEVELKEVERLAAEVRVERVG